MADSYRELLRKTRYTVAGWITNNKIKSRFSQHMNHVLELLKAYKEAQKRKDEKLDEWYKTSIGEDYRRKYDNWRKEYKAGKELGPPPKRPDDLVALLEEKLPENPHDWLKFAPKHTLTGSQRLTRDYVLLLIVHDGYNWKRRDRTRYIREDLVKRGTLTEYVWWDLLDKDPCYEGLIEEALQYVEKDLKESGLLAGAPERVKADLPPEEPSETEQENKKTIKEQEGELKPEPPKILQNILWVLKYGKKHWLILLLILGIAALLWIISNIFVLPKVNLFTKNYSSPKEIKNTSGNYGRTPLYVRTKKRVDDFYERIENEKLSPWLSINAGKMRPVTMHNGKVISIEGVLFTDTVVTIFWSDDFIPPYIEDVMEDVFNQTIEECRKNNLEPKPYLYEAKGLLTGFIHRIYNRMEKISRTLQVKGYPKNISRENIIEKFSKMEERLKEHYDAALLSISKDENTNKNLHQESNDSIYKKWYETMLAKIAGGVIFLAALFTCLGYLLGWLGPIKAFIYRIFTTK